MTFLELAKRRYSVRKYQNKPIEKEKMDLILEAGRIAPTAANRRPQKIYIVKSEEGLKKIREAAAPMAFDAPVVLIMTVDQEKVWNNKLYEPEYTTSEIDGSIVLTHMMLQAYELGIGSVWVRKFDPDKVRTAFAIPEKEHIVSLMPMGYPAEDSAPRETMHLAAGPIEDMIEER